MKTTTKKYIVLCVFITAILFLCSCNAPFDRSGYLKGMLDSTYKGIHQQYSTSTQETIQVLQENYEAFIQREAAIWLQFCGINSQNELHEELYASVIQLIKDLYQLTDYQVADANSQGVVVLTITPLDIYNDVYRDVRKFNEKFKERNTNYEFTDYTDDDFQKAYLDPIISIFRSHMEDPGYGVAITLSIEVAQNNAGQYFISDEDITAIYNSLINYTITNVTQ